mmetsp:Transcript_11397/g.42549  ORF Transcript_11397/g.42549 Transcript_11397/m.42549 type:complete len:283 (-) Transcript_11397:335-1183(-)
MILEGLAYMVHTALSTHPERFVHGAEQEGRPLDSFLRIAAEERRVAIRSQVFEAAISNEKYSEASGFRTDLIASETQWQVAKVLEEGHPILYRLPTWIDELPIDEALEKLYKDVALLFLTTPGERVVDDDGERTTGNFLATHFLTSLWGAERVAGYLPVEEQRAVLKAYYVTIVSFLLTTRAAIPSVEALLGAQEEHDCDDDPDDRVVVAQWNSILPKAVAENEAHNTMLAYVARRLWQRYGHWKGFRAAAGRFTSTPNIGPGRAAHFFMDILRHFMPPNQT